MGKTLYLECYSGISGDMTVAALLDLGADCAVLDRVLKSLKVSGFETKISRVVKSGIDACDFDVVLDKEHENHDHDMEYLHGHHHEGQERNHVHGTGTAKDHACLHHNPQMSVLRSQVCSPDRPSHWQELPPFPQLQLHSSHSGSSPVWRINDAFR